MWTEEANLVCEELLPRGRRGLGAGAVLGSALRGFAGDFTVSKKLRGARLCGVVLALGAHGAHKTAVNNATHPRKFPRKLAMIGDENPKMDWAGNLIMNYQAQDNEAVKYCGKRFKLTISLAEGPDCVP